MTEITLNEILEVLTQEDRSGDGVRVKDLQKATGRSDHWVRRKLEEGLDAGVIERSSRVIERLDGRLVRVGTYRLVPKRKKR